MGKGVVLTWESIHVIQLINAGFFVFFYKQINVCGMYSILYISVNHFFTISDVFIRFIEVDKYSALHCKFALGVI